MKMKKILLLSSIFLLSAVWAVAQYDSQPSASSQSSSSDAGQTTLEGCLGGSNGSYSLTDKSGTTYQLTGDTGKLEHHVGHTMQVTGTASTGSSTSNSSGSMSEAAEAQPTFNVISFKHIAASCTSDTPNTPPLTR